MAAAYLHKEYKKGFILTEESFLKIDELIRKRLSAGAAAEMSFRSLRQDGMLLDYSLPSDLITEENSPRNRITRIMIWGKSPTVDVELNFDVARSVELTIESSVRDTAYLLYSDLKEYLGAEVLKFPLAAISPGMVRLVLPLAAAVFPLGLIMGIHRPDPAKVAAALKSVDIREKMDWIIANNARRSDIGDLKFIFAIVASLFVAILLIGPFVTWLFPHNIFHWGKSAIAYERRRDLRSKLFWGVIVALVIGIASTAVYEKLGP